MEIFGEEITLPEGGGDDDAPNLLGSFIQELEEAIANLEQKIVELETAPTDKELINSIFRAFHNLKGSSSMVGLKTLPELMHYAESVFDHVRSSRMEVSEQIIGLLFDVFGSMREVREALKETSKEGKNRYFTILAKLEQIANEADGEKTEQKAQQAQDPSSEHVHERDGKKSSEDDEFIKISRSLVEQLMLVVGDFMLVESSFQFLKANYGSDWSFIENCQQLAHFSGKLQNTALRMRLSPIKPVFSGMHRVVRSTAAEVEKKVSLEVSGLDTLVDRSILDVISDPIIHMLRNSIDHGLESPDERVRLGKSAEGQITLSAFHRSGEVVIQISDDGKGIDPARIRKKAIEKGFITADAAAQLNDSDCQQLIFLPGFSGAEVVTKVSGRGVGMDVVKQVVEGLGGNIDLVSNLGAGTTITMRLPLSMAISECLEFRLGQKSYAVPQVCIEEVFSLESPLVKENMHTVNKGSEILLLRDTPVPVLDLASLFELETELTDIHIIQVRYGSSRFALKVGSIVGPCNIVCQPLPHIFAGEAPFSGLTRRGDGSLMFQVDLGKLAAKLQVQSDNKSHHGAKIRGGTAITSSDLRRLQQKIAVFKNYESFCVPVHSIKRIVSIARADIHDIDGKSFITLEDVTVPLVWIEQTLLKKSRLEQQNYPVLIFQIEDQTFGLPMGDFNGIIRMPTQYDSTLRSDIIIGTTVIESETCMVIDLFGLAAQAYGTKVSARPKDNILIKKVAIAEDDPFFREQLIAFLKAREIDSVAFPDGLALKEFLSSPDNAKTVQAVLSDIEMPRMDGLSLTRWIKGNPSLADLPCVIITSLTNKEVVRLAMSAGASAFVPKMHHQQVMQELKRIESGLDKPDHGTDQFSDHKQVSRRIVTFTVGDDHFAMPMEVLKEVSHDSPSLPVPSYPHWMNNVTAFRGKMVPVVDLRKLFNLTAKHSTPKTHQAIVDYNGYIVAIIFDTIGEVLLVSQLETGEGISKTTKEETHLAQYLKGIFQKDQKLISLIDPAALVKTLQGKTQNSNREDVAV